MGSASAQATRHGIGAGHKRWNWRRPCVTNDSHGCRVALAAPISLASYTSSGAADAATPANRCFLCWPQGHAWCRSRELRALSSMTSTAVSPETHWIIVWPSGRRRWSDRHGPPNGRLPWGRRRPSVLWCRASFSRTPWDKRPVSDRFPQRRPMAQPIPKPSAHLELHCRRPQACSRNRRRSMHARMRGHATCSSANTPWAQFHQI